ncbi:MAG: RidA family protein [Armatimonadetes bacterium]|nr:RidA family protein [Armatimonadota bacterium]
MRKVIRTERAPQPVGPYSQAIIANGFVYVAGQGPADPATGRWPEDVAGQTAQTLRNIQAILEAAGCSLADVIKTNVYLADRRDFGVMNEVYKQFFPTDPPARTTVQAHPPVEIKVEIDCIAVLPEQ